MTILAFRLWGPMAAWGGPQSGRLRKPTLSRPSRSAILGLVATALGARREEQDIHDALDRHLLTACASHGAGHVEEDFTITQSVDTTSRPLSFESRREALDWAERIPSGSRVVNTMSHREYLSDALWRIFLCTRPTSTPSILGPLAAALDKPAFQPFLGRAAMPVGMPLTPRMIKSDELREAVKEFPCLPETTDNPDGKHLNTLERRIINRHSAELSWDEGFPGAPEPEERTFGLLSPLNRQRRTFTQQRIGICTLASD